MSILWTPILLEDLNLVILGIIIYKIWGTISPHKDICNIIVSNKKLQGRVIYKSFIRTL